MTNQQISSKSLARIAAIQVFYQFTNREGDVDTILLKIKSLYKDSDFKLDHGLDKNSKLKLRPSYSYLDELVKHSYEKLPEIDDVITGFLTKRWSLDNMPVLLRNVLRVAISELMHFPETPRKVIINEYTDIASDMLGDREVGFVNSVLHNYSETLFGKK